MFKAIVSAALLVSVAFAGNLDLSLEMGTSTPIGGWGTNLSAGLGAGVQATWLVSSKLRTGIGAEGMLFSDGNSGRASFQQFKPMAVVSFYLRPHGRSFNPGLTAAFGYCRSRLSSHDGIDPASWDPFWRAGVRWNFSIGEPWRAGLGFDLESVMAQELSGDALKFVFGISREVGL